MAKYYIQSGTLRATLAAEDSRRAALWAVHQAMQQVLPVYDDPDLTAQQKSDHAMVEGMFVLEGKIKLSEQGFDRDDAELVDTFDVVIEWNKLMVALDRLEKLFGE
ncbi:hypothetical protein SH139x_000087 [Planctomycetaceae bacterium SH139]